MDIEKPFSEEKTSKVVRFERVIKSFKDYIPVCIAIATIFGGINQFFNLLSIGSYYVRFFSASQLLSDGLWIIYLLFPVYIGLILISPIIFIDDEYVHLRFSPLNKEGKFVNGKVVWANLILLLPYAVCYYYIFNGRWPYACILLLTYALPALIVNLKLSKKFTSEVSLLICSLFSFIIFSSSIYFSWIWIFNSDKIPSNLANNSILKKIVEKEFPSFEHQILYMNDKYIFSKIYCDSVADPQSKIFIISTESMTELK